MAFLNIDTRGNKFNRDAVRGIQRCAGMDERKAAAQAKRDRKAARRAALGRDSAPATEDEPTCIRS